MGEEAERGAQADRGAVEALIAATVDRLRAEKLTPIQVPVRACRVARYEGCAFHHLALAASFNLAGVSAVQLLPEVPRRLPGGGFASVLVLHLDRPGARVLLAYQTDEAALLVPLTRWVLVGKDGSQTRPRDPRHFASTGCGESGVLFPKTLFQARLEKRNHGLHFQTLFFRKFCLPHGIGDTF